MLFGLFKKRKKGFNVSDKSEGPFRVTSSGWNSESGARGKIKADLRGVEWGFSFPRDTGVFCEMMNSAYRLGREDEKREREAKATAPAVVLTDCRFVSAEASGDYLYVNFTAKPAPKFKKGDRVRHAEYGAGTVRLQYMGLIEPGEQYGVLFDDSPWGTTPCKAGDLELIPSTISRKFIGGPMDGQTWYEAPSGMRAYAVGHGAIAPGGVIPTNTAIYKLGTVNGEPYMIYQRPK